MKTTSLILTTLMVTLLGAIAAPEGKEGEAKPDKPPGGGKGPRPNPEELFKKLDTDASGDLSLDEFKKHPRHAQDATKAEEVYKKMDANSDSKVTLEELKAHRPPPPPGGGKGGPGKGGKGGEGGKGGPGGPPPPPPAESK
jgi:hypothetical protein